MNDNVGHSVIAAFNIQSENKDSKAVVIDATPFLVSDYAQISDNIKWYYGQKPISDSEVDEEMRKLQG